MSPRIENWVYCYDRCNKSTGSPSKLLQRRTFLWLILISPLAERVLIEWTNFVTYLIDAGQRRMKLEGEEIVEIDRRIMIKCLINWTGVCCPDKSQWQWDKFQSIAEIKVNLISERNSSMITRLFSEIFSMARGDYYSTAIDLFEILFAICFRR